MPHQTHQTHQPGAGERRGASAQAERRRRGPPTTKREAGGGAQQPTTAEARTRATASQASSLESGSLPLSVLRTERLSPLPSDRGTNVATISLHHTPHQS